MRKYINTLVAIAVLGALWGGFTYYGKHKANEPAPAAKKEEKILNLDAHQIQSFTLNPRDGEAFTCNRDPSGQWAIVEPKKLTADQSAIGSFLSTLTSATVDEVVSANPGDLKQFGLDDPQETLSLTTRAKPEKWALVLGDDTPASGGVYAQVAGNARVVTLASYLKSSLEKKVFDLRDKRAVTLNLDQLKQIEVKSAKGSYTLEKNPEGVWDLQLPPPVRADHFTVEGIVNQLRTLSMQSVASESKADSGKYGLASPALTVKLSAPAGTQSLVFGKKEEKGGGIYAANSALDPVFALESSVLDQLQKQPADLRDKDLFSFSQFDAKHVEISTPAGHRAFDLQGKDWKQTAPAAKTLAKGSMDDLLSDLRDLRAASFPSGLSVAAAGLAQPAYRFEVRFGESNQEEVVEVSKVKDHLYARRSTDPLPCELASGALDSLEKTLAKL